VRVNDISLMGMVVALALIVILIIVMTENIKDNTHRIEHIEEMMAQ